MVISAEDKYRLAERLIFWYERLATIFLTISWIDGCYRFLVYPEIFNISRISSLLPFSYVTVTNTIYFLFYLSGRFPFIKEALLPGIPDEVQFSRNWDDIERLAFWNERVGMLFVIISNIVGLSYSTRLIVCFFPCIILFPFANILYLEWFFIFGKNKLEIPHHHDESKEVKDHHDESEEVKEESGKINETDCANEGRLVDDLNGMPELEEEKEENDDEFFVEQDDIDKPALEEEKVVEEIDNRSEEKYRKKLEKFEKKWVKKMENVKEKYKEKCKNWKQQESDLLSKLSSVSSRAGFYKIQVSESEEKLRRLEDEKIELITKLTTANASSELYRSLLHDPSSTPQCWPSL